MVTRPNQILSMQTGCVEIRERSYAVLDLEAPGYVQSLVQPGGYVANYLDKEQDAWFVKQYINRLDKCREQIVVPFTRLLHYRAPLDIVLTSSEDEEVCYRQLLKRWLADELPDTVAGGEITGACVEIDTPTRIIIEIDSPGTKEIEEIKFLIGCHFIIDHPDQYLSIEKMMRYHPLGPIINISGKPLGSDLEVVKLNCDASLIPNVRKLLWEPQKAWLPCKESNSELDQLYRAARKTV